MVPEVCKCFICIIVVEQLSSFSNIIFPSNCTNILGIKERFKCRSAGENHAQVQWVIGSGSREKRRDRNHMWKAEIQLKKVQSEYGERLKLEKYFKIENKKGLPW